MEGSVSMGGGCQGLCCCKDTEDRDLMGWGTLKAVSPGTGGRQWPYPTGAGGR